VPQLDSSRKGEIVKTEQQPICQKRLGGISGTLRQPRSHELLIVFTLTESTDSGVKEEPNHFEHLPLFDTCK
jgi:hypothetical protein